MELKAGDVVILKSGGLPLTVAEVSDGMVSCVWIGEEGDLFREALPSAVLELAHIDLSDDEDEDEDEHHGDEDSEDDDHHDKEKANAA